MSEHVHDDEGAAFAIPPDEAARHAAERAANERAAASAPVESAPTPVESAPTPGESAPTPEEIKVLARGLVSAISVGLGLAGATTLTSEQLDAGAEAFRAPAEDLAPYLGDFMRYAPALMFTIGVILPAARTPAAPKATAPAPAP